MSRPRQLAALLALLCLPQAGLAQWFELQDPQTGAWCDVINAQNVRLVIKDPDNTLILITGPDRELVNAVVDEENAIVIEGERRGFVQFANDAEGRRRVFWVAENNSLYRLESDGQAVATELFPEDVAGDCDACPLWDNEADCAAAPPAEEGPRGTGPVGGLCGIGSGGASLASAFGLVTLGLVRARRRP
jgi:hypothetical protein